MKEEVHQFVAFDFGDGTTCAAYYNATLDRNRLEPQVLVLEAGKITEVWSVLGYDSNGENPRIGNQSRVRGYNKPYTYWKRKPSQYASSPEAMKLRKVSIDFMRLVFKSFLTQNSDYTAEGLYLGKTYTIIIGVPCDWDVEDIKEYRKMTTEAGLPNVEVVKESQAAMFYAKRFMRGGISDDAIRKGVLLIDVGSSTTDFTYMKGVDQIAHCGVALGAHSVEGAFLAEALIRENLIYWDNSSNTGWQILAADRESGERMQLRDELKVRECKEEYFKQAGIEQNPEVEGVSVASNRAFVGQIVQDDDTGEKKGWITSDFVKKCLEDDSSPCPIMLDQISHEWDGVQLDTSRPWRGHFRAVLKHVKTKWKIDSSTTIVVTGGATRMQFVEKDIMDVFGSFNKPYFNEDNARSYSVVKGLAYCGFAREQAQKTKQDMENSFQQSNICDTLGINKYVEQLLDAPAENIATQVRNRICQLLGDKDASVSSINKIGEKYSELLCAEWNKLSERFNAGISVKKILDGDKCKQMSVKVYNLLGRPEMTISTDVTAAFRYNMVEASIRFNPLGHIFWEPEPDEGFNTCFFDKFGPAATKCQEMITKDLILGHFTSLIREVSTGEKKPSFAEHLMSAILEMVKDYKLKEIDIITGTLEYDKDRKGKV